MNDMTAVSIIAMLGFLLVAGMSFASFRLSWGKTAQMALTWLAIFVGLFLVVRMLGLRL